MANFWYTVIIAFALLATLLAHELAHALAMRHNGVQVEEVGLGLPLPPRLLIYVKGLPFRLSLSPWLFGAYAKPHQDSGEHLESLPRKERAWIYGAGVIANALIFTALQAVHQLVVNEPLRVLGYATAGVALWALRRQVAAYLIPLLSIPALIALLYVTMTSLGQPNGPVALAVGLGQMAEESHSLDEMLRVTAALNLSLASINIIPLHPLDGGRIVGGIITRFASARVAHGFQVVGTAATITLLVYGIVSDLFFL